jgi:indole-3-glycerol phosphate synthase
MKTILDEIAEKTFLRVVAVKEKLSFDNVRNKAIAIAEDEFANGKNRNPNSFLFEQSLRTTELSFICEVKKASPSKGIIAEDFPYLEIAKEYEIAGASAISVLTEPDYFLGSDLYLQEIAAAVSLPVLLKDFIIDAYQIYEAKLLGASAVLLICALLSEDKLFQFINIAHELGMSALVEIHNEAEIEQALKAGARIIGINNRDLKTFNVDLAVTARLRKLIPQDKIVVAESGIKSADDIRAIKKINVDAVLIGESFMRAGNKKQFLAELKGAYHEN